MIMKLGIALGFIQKFTGTLQQISIVIQVHDQNSFIHKIVTSTYVPGRPES